LLWRNNLLAASIPFDEIIESFSVGMRFDLIITAYVMIPLVLYVLYPRGLNQHITTIWVTMIAGLITFLAVLELDFYHEFHIRLNSLVFQYLREDADTVLSMLWHGFPVLRYCLLWIILTSLFYWSFSNSSQWIENDTSSHTSYPARFAGFMVIAIITAFAARGTLRQGPPLRWGDAFHSQSLFANHLALNGSFTLTKAILAEFKRHQHSDWLNKMPMTEAIKTTQALLLTDSDHLVNAQRAPVYRTYHAGKGLASNRPLNVVLILMESFSAAFIDSTGHQYGITPAFDRLRQQGLLFNHFFSNGTHTHQGMFASMACFPNLPGYETLMQQPQGDTQFAGLLKIVHDRGYQSLYLYNGDFAWDNQQGFFGRQGMQTFIGRDDFINPIFSDPTWGVSDEDMFNRAALEFANMPTDKPFFAFLQSLSNHTPYALPDPLPVQPVTGFGELNQHLTAMRYSDWALGEFFRKAQQSDYYENTLFVIVGDHGFSTSQQITDIDLLRYHIPLLIIAPGIVKRYGSTRSIVGSQVDIVPIIAGLLGGNSTHGCWGRDLLNVNDEGFAVIKPSGSDQTTALFTGDMILVKQPRLATKLYHYSLGNKATATFVSDHPRQRLLNKQLEAYIQTAMDSLVHGKTGLQ